MVLPILTDSVFQIVLPAVRDFALLVPPLTWSWASSVVTVGHLDWHRWAPRYSIKTTRQHQGSTRSKVIVISTTCRNTEKIVTPRSPPPHRAANASVNPRSTMAAREPPTDDSPRPRVPSSGVWAPTVTFFDPDTDELDLDAQTRYFQYLARHLTGLVVLGTNSETMLLTREERAAMLRAARHAVGPGYELMAGVSGHSTRQVLEYIGDAAAAGADYALLLPCAYFGKQTTPQVVVDFYDQVAPKSALPIVIYARPPPLFSLNIRRRGAIH